VVVKTGSGVLILGPGNRQDAALSPRWRAVALGCGGAYTAPGRRTEYFTCRAARPTCPRGTCAKSSAYPLKGHESSRRDCFRARALRLGLERLAPLLDTTHRWDGN